MNKAVPAAAILFMYVERAHGLPVSLFLFAERTVKLLCSAVFLSHLI